MLRLCLYTISVCLYAISVRLYTISVCLYILSVSLYTLIVSLTESSVELKFTADYVRTRNPLCWLGSDSAQSMPIVETDTVISRHVSLLLPGLLHQRSVTTYSLMSIIHDSQDVRSVTCFHCLPVTDHDVTD